MSSTEALTQLHEDFEQNVLSVGLKIPPRWRLMHEEENSSQQQVKDVGEPEQVVEEFEKTSCDEETNERGTPAVEIHVVPDSSSLASDSLPERPRLHKDLSCSVPSEVSLRAMVCMVQLVFRQLP